MTRAKPGIGPWVGLCVLSLGLHLFALDQRAFHSDEAVHAQAAYKLLHEGTYRYDPTYHGPLLYFLTAAGFGFLGDSDFSARLPVALCGWLMLYPAACLRSALGERTAWWSGLLLTISPTLLYYGRFLNMDLLEALTTSAALVYLRGALERRNGRAWIAVGIWVGLAFATKENAYVTLFLIAAVLMLLASWNGWKYLIPNSRQWLQAHGVGVGTAAATALIVVLTLYTVFLRYPEDWRFPYSAIRYWAHQHAIERVSGPWWYYLPRLALYEFLIFAAATIRICRRAPTLAPLEVFLYLFGFFSVAMYAYLGEKAPWLAVHQIWPFVPLAAGQLAETFGAHGASPGRLVATAAILATAAFAIRANFLLEDISPSRTQNEALIYVQTTPAFRHMAEDLREHAGTDEETPVAAVEGQGTWPLVWYWRHLPVWWDRPGQGMAPPVVVTDMENLVEVSGVLGPGYRRERIPIRAWWLMESHRPSFSELVRYVVSRTTWSGLGSTDAVVLRKASVPQASVRTASTPSSIAASLSVDATRVLGEGWLVEPRGVSVRHGRVAVADAAMSNVTLFSDAGVAHTVRVADGLSEPEGLAWTLNGDLLVADTWNHRIVRLFGGASESARTLDPVGGWYGPRGVAIGHNGGVAISDTGNKRIIVADARLRRPRILGEAGADAGQFNEPVGVTWVGSDLLVADTGNRRLQLIDVRGHVRRIVRLPDAWSDYYARPQVVAIRSDLWLATDPPAATVWVIRGSDVSPLRVGQEGIRPGGLAWDTDSRKLYLTDLNGRCWEFHVNLD